jgi:spoIIIJ-associated protein
VKDAVFSGETIEAALQAASRDLGVPAGQLRYVVLEKSGAGARLAVLLEASAPGRSAAPAADPGTEIPRLVSAFAEAAGLDVAVELAGGGESTLTATLVGPDIGFFLEEDGRVLRALELLVQRALARDGVRIRVTVEGYRELRDERIRQKTLELVKAALEDGQPRLTEPLNSYERRIVHMAASEHEGVRTESEGDEGERRVRILPA